MFEVLLNQQTLSLVLAKRTSYQVVLFTEYKLNYMDKNMRSYSYNFLDLLRCAPTPKRYAPPVTEHMPLYIFM